MDERHESESDEGMYPEEIELPTVNIPRQSLEELGKFLAQSMKREELNMDITEKHMDRLYSEIGDPDEAITFVLAYLQNRHQIDIEVLAEKRDVEDMFWQRYSHFDDNVWEKFLKTGAVSALHAEVYKLSQRYIPVALDEVIRRDKNTPYPEVSPPNDEDEEPF